jgi:hypothetical protein
VLGRRARGRAYLYSLSQTLALCLLPATLSRAVLRRCGSGASKVAPQLRLRDPTARVRRNGSPGNGGGRTTARGLNRQGEAVDIRQWCKRSSSGCTSVRFASRFDSVPRNGRCDGIRESNASQVQPDATDEQPRTDGFSRMSKREWENGVPPEVLARHLSASIRCQRPSLAEEEYATMAGTRHTEYRTQACVTSWARPEATAFGKNAATPRFRGWP